MKLRELEVGAKVILGSYSVNGQNPEPITWLKIGHNDLFISEHILEQMAYDSMEGSAPNGNTSYPLSNLRQFLNSYGVNWFSKTHDGDEPPESIDDICGFLSYFTEDELKCLFLHPETDDLISIPSVGELDNGIEKTCGATKELHRHTRHGSDRPSEYSWWYWVRDDHRNDEVRCVNREGSYTTLNAKDSGVGVRPIIVIDPESEVELYNAEELWKVVVKDNLILDVSDEDLFKILNM